MARMTLEQIEASRPKVDRTKIEATTERILPIICKRMKKILMHQQIILLKNYHLHEFVNEFS